MMQPSDVLGEAHFGSRIAEDESDALKTYFVKTEHWRKIVDGEVDIVFGAKGSGKSALYSLLVAQKEEFRLGRRTMFLPAENPRGTPAFRDLTTEPPLPEQDFRGLWKLYFLSIAADYMRHNLAVTTQRNIAAEKVITTLADLGLLPRNATLGARLKAVMEYLRTWIPTVEGSVTDPNSGMKIGAKITFSEPTVEQRERGYQSLDDLIRQLNLAFEQMNITIWLVLDRLDVAFADSDELEANALRSLFRAYLDMIGLSHIRLKIFLRDDIWKKIGQGGFREASHITRTINIQWDEPSLLNLIVRRLISNDGICSFYNLNRHAILGSAELQKDTFYKIFPKQVEVGKGKPTALDWMISRTADGSRRTAPRELIHLLLETRDQQLRQFHLGNASPIENRLFDSGSIKLALPGVSKARLELTLYAEHPSLKVFLERLEREKTQQTSATLARLWSCTETRASEVAERLVEVGFFERRGTKEVPVYWVPFLYREALDMLQGSA